MRKRTVKRAVAPKAPVDPNVRVQNRIFCDSVELHYIKGWLSRGGFAEGKREAYIEANKEAFR